MVLRRSESFGDQLGCEERISYVKRFCLLILQRRGNFFSEPLWTMSPVGERGHIRGGVIELGIHHHVSSEGFLQAKPFVIGSQLGVVRSFDPHVLNFISFFINGAAYWQRRFESGIEPQLK